MQIAATLTVSFPCLSQNEFNLVELFLQMNRFNQSTSCDLMIDSIRLELSYPLLSTVEKILSATLMDDICDWLLIRKSDQMKHSGTKNKVQYNCQLTNINIFASCENKGNENI